MDETSGVFSEMTILLQSVWVFEIRLFFFFGRYPTVTKRIITPLSILLAICTLSCKDQETKTFAYAQISETFVYTNTTESDIYLEWCGNDVKYILQRYSKGSWIDIKPDQQSKMRTPQRRVSRQGGPESCSFPYQRALRLRPNESRPIFVHFFFMWPDRSEGQYRLELFPFLAKSGIGKNVLFGENFVRSKYSSVLNAQDSRKTKKMQDDHFARRTRWEKERFGRLLEADFNYENRTGKDLYLTWCGRQHAYVLEKKNEANGKWEEFARRDMYSSKVEEGLWVVNKIGTGVCDLPYMGTGLIPAGDSTTITVQRPFDAASEIDGRYRLKLKAFREKNQSRWKGNIRPKDYPYQGPVENQYADERKVTIDMRDFKSTIQRRNAGPPIRSTSPQQPQESDPRPRR